MSEAIQETILILSHKRDQLSSVIEQLQEIAGIRTEVCAVSAPIRRAHRKPRRSAVRAAANPQAEPVAAGPDAGLRALAEDITDDTSSVDETAIAFDQGLPESFTAKDMKAVMPGPEQRAHWWIAGWLRKGWIEKTGEWGQYRRTATFGQ